MLPNGPGSERYLLLMLGFLASNIWRTNQGTRIGRSS